MNAAFLLVTSAMLVGQPAAAPKPAPPPAAVASSCGHDCDCDGFGHKFRDKMRGWFNRDSCDSCQPTTCHTPHCHKSIFKSSCDDACKPKLWSWQPKCHEPKCHEPKCHEHKCHEHKACAPACDSCEGGGFLSKLRARFQRNDACCTSSCGSAPAKGAEKIDTAPKKMPDVKGGKTTEEVRIEPQATPFTPNVIQVTPAVPSIEVVPAPAPRVGGDRRDPF